MGPTDTTTRAAPTTGGRPDDDADASDRRERFRLVYDRSYHDLVAFCRRRAAAADVDDLVAETFLLAWQRFDELDGDVRPWLFGVAHNHLRNRSRKVRRSATLHETLIAEILARQEAADDALAPDEVRALVEALAALRDDDAEVLRLGAWEGLSHGEMAVVLGCSVNAVGIRVHRARRRLRTVLARDPRWPDPADDASGAHERKADRHPRQVDDDGPHDDTKGTPR